MSSLIEFIDAVEMLDEHIFVDAHAIIIIKPHRIYSNTTVLILTTKTEISVEGGPTAIAKMVIEARTSIPARVFKAYSKGSQA